MRPDAARSLVLEVAGLTRVYPSGAREIRALDNVSFTLAAGSCLAVVGHSGSGKSTLLNLLAGLDRPSSGRIEVGGRDLASLTRKQLARFRAEEVGVIFQSFHLLPYRTALENVETGLQFLPLGRAERRRRAEEMLSRVGLADRAGHRPDSLSGGEKQRIAVARALAKQPRLLLADEPTGNLDRETSGEIETLLAGLNQQGQTLILVTHDLALADRLSQRTLRLEYGRVLEPEGAR